MGQLKLLFRFLRRDSGSAVVDFVLVLPILVATFISVSELAMVAERRSVLTSSVDQGVRVASVADGSLDEGVARTKSVLADHDISSDEVQLKFVRTRSSGINYVVGTARWPMTVMGIGIDITAITRSIDESKM